MSSVHEFQHDLDEEVGATRAYAKVYALLEHELTKFKDRGDLHAAEVTEVLLAKIRALEKVF